MASKILIAAALIATAMGLPSDKQNVCPMEIHVDYVEGAPTVRCSSPCPRGENGFTFDGSAYKRFTSLDGYNQMVQVIYTDGALTRCQLVPLQTSEALAAREAQLNQLRQECRSRIFGETSSPIAPVETTAAPVETTAAPVETTAAPVETTAVPVETTAAPVETTAAPIETTAAPVETTAAPVETTAAAVEIRKRCLEGFTLVGDSCYMVTPYPASKLESSKYCSKYGAKSTAIIDSQEEQDKLKEVLSTNVWIELNDQRQEGRFTAPGLGSRFFTSWQPGEPNDSNQNEDCVELIPVWNYNWNDANCASNIRGLCESAPLPVFDEPKCAKGQYQFEDSCYFFSARGNFDTAAAECKRRGGYPAFINSQKEHDFLASIAGDSVFLGYTDRVQESVFVAENFGVMIYKNWNEATAEPNNQNNKEDCSEMNKRMGYKWNDVDCAAEQRAICETAPPTKCAAGQYKYKDSCYFFSEAADFDTGAAECRRNGGYPAYVNSQQEQDFLKSIVSDSVFLGYTDRNRESIFVADDGAELLYSSWQPGEPNNAGEEHCSELRKNFNYMWNDVTCTNVQRTLCETAASFV